MPKKFIILSTISALVASSLAGLVPAALAIQHDGPYGSGDYYDPSEFIPMREQYLAELASSCSTPSTNPTYSLCRTSFYDRFTERHGTLANVASLMGQSEGAMLVTGFNPTAGTLRFYVDAIGSKLQDPYEYANFYIYWLDDTAEVKVTNDLSLAKSYAEPLAAGTVPQGVHLLYGSQQGRDDWLATMGAEHRVVYTDAGDLIDGSQSRQIFLAGYDTSGQLHFGYNGFADCAGNGYSYGAECRSEYYYARSSYAFFYVQTDATAEDLALIQAKRLAELEQTIREAEEAARLATEAAAAAAERAQAAEEIAKAAREQAATASSSASEAKSRATEAESRAAEAESHANEAESRATEANERAGAAETAAEVVREEAARANAEAEAAKSAADQANARAAAAESTAASSAAALETILDQLASLASNLASARQELADLAARPATSTTIIQQYTNSTTSTDSRPASVLADITTQATEAEGVAKTTDSTTTDCPDSESVTLPVTHDGSGEASSFPWWILAIVLPGFGVLIWWFLLPAHPRTSR